MPFQSQKDVLADNPFRYFWFGLGVTVGFLQLWNLFLPITFYCWLGLLPLVCFGAIKFARQTGTAKIERPSGIVLVLLLAVLIFLVISSLDNSFIYDTRVYHFQLIKWASGYAVVSGMANVFIYLGFNHSYFLFAAFLNGLWGHYKGACATNGLLVAAMCAEIILLNARYLLRKEKPGFHAIFQLLFLPLCINGGVRNLSSPTPDVFNNLLAIRLISDVIRCVETKKISFQDIFLIGFYCVFGAAMKLSALVPGIAVVMILLFLATKNKLWQTKGVLVSLAWFAIIIGAYLLRSVISSGYLLFPSYSIGFPVDWKVPVNLMAGNYDFTIGFARTSEHGTVPMLAAHNYSWVGGWFERLVRTTTFTIPVVLLITSVVIMKIKKIQASSLWLFYGPLLLSVIFWFFSAPDVRFAVFFFWSIGFIALAWLLSQLNYKWMNLFPAMIIICSFLIIVKNWNTEPAPLGNLPKQPTTTFVTKSGLKVNIVKAAPGRDIYTLNDMPIPCSFPNVDSNLMMRGTSIQDGFKIVKTSQ